MDVSKHKTKLKAYFRSVPDGVWITAYKLSQKTGLSLEEATAFLDEHVQKGIVDKRKAVRCPECGFLVKRVARDENLLEDELCYNCDSYFDARYNCTEDIYNISELCAMYFII